MALLNLVRPTVAANQVGLSALQMSPPFLADYVQFARNDVHQHVLRDDRLELLAAGHRAAEERVHVVIKFNACLKHISSKF